MEEYSVLTQKLSNLDYTHHLTTTSIALLVRRLNGNRQQLLRKRRERDSLTQSVRQLEEEVSLIACDISDESSQKEEVRGDAEIENLDNLSH